MNHVSLKFSTEFEEMGMILKGSHKVISIENRVPLVDSLEIMEDIFVFSDTRSVCRVVVLGKLEFVRVVAHMLF